MCKYIIYNNNNRVGVENTEEIWKNSDILQMKIHSVLFESDMHIDIEFDFRKKTLIYYKIYDKRSDIIKCELKYANDNVYITEKGKFWRVNKNIIPYEFAKYKMPIFIQMNVAGFIPYYDITRKEMLYLSVRKKSQYGYQILSPEYSELLYDGQILEKYENRDFSVIRVQW